MATATSAAELQALASLLAGPAMTPPAGVTPNFVDPWNIQTAGWVAVSIFLGLSTLAMIGRMFTKAFVIRKIDPEDWTMLAAWIVTECFVWYISIKMKPVGWGTHQWDVRLGEISDFLHYFWIGAVIYGLATLLVKISILQQYLRVFRSNSKRDFIFWTCHGLMWINIVYYLIGFFLLVFSCNPVEGFWNILITEKKCIDQTAMNIATAVMNAVSDFAIWALPQATIWKLKMDTTKKLGITAILSFGLLACFAAIVRLYFSAMLIRSKDQTWYLSLIAMMIPVELGLGIMTGCLPGLAKLFKTIRASFGTKLGTAKSSYFQSSKVPSSQRSAVGARDRSSKSYAPMPDDYELALNPKADTSIRASPLPMQDV